MSEGFYSLKVKKAVKETADATTFYFEIPDNLKDTFSYHAGQYLTIEATISGESVRRSYSLCTFSGVDADLAVTVKKVDLGKMSTFLNDTVKEGDMLEVMPPMGKFTAEIQSDKSRHFVLFGGGSGITPLMGLAKQTLYSEPNSKVSLVYANRNPESVIFKNNIAELEKEFAGRFKVYLSYDQAPFTWFGLKGMLTLDKIQSIVKQKIGGSFDQYLYYTCGPGPMMETVKSGLKGLGIADSQIFIEYFQAPTSSKKSESTEINDTVAEFNGMATVTATVYGKTHTFSCDSKTTILKAAQKHGIDPPYSCTVGVCTTCRAKVSKGNVYMLEREGLSDKEIADGFVLTCQSVPTSSEIELSYE